MLIFAYSCTLDYKNIRKVEIFENIRSICICTWIFMYLDFNLNFLSRLNEFLFQYLRVKTISVFLFHYLSHNKFVKLISSFIIKCLIYKILRNSYKDKICIILGDCIESRCLRLDDSSCACCCQRHLLFMSF